MVGFDTETTGVDFVTDRIVTAAVIFRDGADGAVSARTWLIDPGIEIPERATAVHGITTEMAREQGADPVVALGEIAALLAAALANGSPIVAFNAGYDLGILDAELARHGLPSLARRIGAAHTLRPVVAASASSSTCAITTGSPSTRRRSTPPTPTCSPLSTSSRPWPAPTQRSRPWTSPTSTISK
jgi:hypothetical protein